MANVVSDNGARGDCLGAGACGGPALDIGETIPYWSRNLMNDFKTVIRTNKNKNKSDLVANRVSVSIVGAFAVLVSLVLSATGALAVDKDDPLDQRIAGTLEDIFPDADGIGEIFGAPPVAEILADGEVIGYAFSTYDTAPIGGFTGIPFDLVVGMDLEARVQGVALVEHHEPIISHNAIPVSRLTGFFKQLTGFRVDGSLRGVRSSVDGVSGATVSSELMRSAIIAAARKIAKQHGIIESFAGGVVVDMDSYQARDWQTLLDEGAVARMRVSGAEGDLVEVYTALATPIGIGRNFFGDNWHSFHLSELGADDHLVVIASSGKHQLFKQRPRRGEAYASARIVQDGRILPLSMDNKLGKPSILTDGAPFLNERAMFRLGPKDGFDPLKTWTLEFELPDGGEAAVYELPYALPATYVTGSDFALEEAGYKEPRYVVFGLLRESLLSDWQRVWAARVGDIAILGALLLGVTLMLIYQDRITPHRKLFMGLRLGFLAVVLVWLGWHEDAQLTTLNIVTYVITMVSGMDWAPILLDPLIFLLSVYVLISLVLWGRGVFCGWLCPFGALQELTNRLARLIRLPQLTIGEAANEKLWALKYVFTVVIFGLAFWSIDAAQIAAEVEPFKTAIVVGFERDWPYLLYAGVLIGAGLFVERFFCRYLCPLGGALGLLGRWHVFRWLRQRPECGDPCAVCRRACPVDAIEATGAINMNECFQCMDCQLEYFDDKACPPLIQRRKQAERGLAA